MLQVLTEAESKKFKEEILDWVKKVLNGDYGTYMNNILYGLKSFSDAIEHDKEKCNHDPESPNTSITQSDMIPNYGYCRVCSEEIQIP